MNGGIEEVGSGLPDVFAIEPSYGARLQTRHAVRDRTRCPTPPEPPPATPPPPDSRRVGTKFGCSEGDLLRDEMCSEKRFSESPAIHGCSGSHMNVLGVNAVFHDPAAALVVDGVTVAAAEEERFSRRKHGKLPVPFSTWELPEQAMAFCLAEAGLSPADLDAVAYSYDPDLAPPGNGDVTAAEWEGLRTLYARRAPLFLRASLPGLDPGRVRWVAHHVAHAASATFASGFDPCDVLVVDGRGERASHLAGRFAGGALET